VTLSRLVLLFLLATLIATTGCSNYWAQYTDPARKYYRVRVTNPRGELIADYIAENRPARTERGFRFKAVERLSSPPFQREMRYPRGRIIEVAGPNILVARCGKPLWLYELDGF
jgi:hypothetical protein